MKKNLGILISIFCITSCLYGSDVLNKAKNLIFKGINKIRYGDDYNNPFEQYDRMRCVLFEQLKEKYNSSMKTELSKEDILKLKNQLADKNTRSVIRNEDISSCLIGYSDISHTMKEENNIYFIDTILPVLLEGYTFNRTDIINRDISTHSIFTWSKDNTYLMRNLIFNHQIPLRMTNVRTDSWTFHMLDRVRDLKKLYGSEEGYLKTILTPPETWLQQTKKDIISSMCFFIIGLQKLKKENPQSCASYNLPKALIFNCILRELIKSSVFPEAHNTAANIVNDINADLVLIKKREEIRYAQFVNLPYSERQAQSIIQFLEKDFEPWAQDTINPEKFLYNAIVKTNKKKVN